MEPVHVDLAQFPPEPRTCKRCGARAEMRFPGVCPECASHLRATYAGEARTIDATYEPKMNVTPNAVAQKDG